MRNLKKILALVLALVMSLSLVTMANADFSDAADIDNKEAVDVMAAAGILEGANGAFSPKDILTREQAAKIVTYMILGGEKADKLGTVIAPFSDVAADRWSAGAIAYCVDNGILAGIGNNQFNPTGKLTGLAFAKMLLVALGYDPAIEKLEGNQWAIKTATLAIDLGLDSGLSGALSAEMSREDAAQMALNVAKATMVYYREPGTNITLSDGTSIIVGASAAEAVVPTTDAATIADNATVQFAEKYMTKLELSTEGTDAADAFGRPAHTWIYDGEPVGTYADTAKYTIVLDKNYAKTTTEAEILEIFQDKTGNKKLDYAKTAGSSDVDLFVNGTPGTFADLGDDGSNVYTDGVVAEIFCDKNTVTDIVLIQYTLVKVDDITALTAGQLKTNANSDDDEVVAAKNNVKLVLASNNGSSKTLYDTKIVGFDYAEGDYILAALNNTLGSTTKVLDTKAAETVTGTISAVKGGKYNIGGTYYDANSGNTTNPTVGINTEGTWALDAAGNLAADVDVTEYSSDYIYIYSIVKSTTSTDGLASDSFTAYGVTQDGEKVSYPVATEKGTTATDIYLKGKKDVAAFQLDNADDDTLVSGANPVTLVTAYKVVDGKIEATTGDATVKGAVSTTYDVDKNNAAVGSGEFATNDTKFVFVKVTDSVKVATAVGFKNVNITASTTNYIPVVNSANKATVVFVTGDAAALDSSASTVVAVKLNNSPVYTKDATSGDETWTYTFGVKGAEVEVAQSAEQSTVGGYAIGDIFTYTLDASGDMTPDKTAITTSKYVAFIDGDQLQTSDSKTIDLSAVEQYTITIHSESDYAEVTAGASYSTDSTADGYNLAYYTNTDGDIKVVFVINTIDD